MTEFSNDLLKEAIADANAVRETAVANAKLQLEESITPRVQAEIARILRNEQESDVDEAYDPHKGQNAQDFAEVGEGINPSSSGIGTSDNKEPSADAKNSSDAGNDGGQEIMDGEHTKAEKHESLPGKDEDMTDAPKPGTNVNEEGGVDVDVDVEDEDEDEDDDQLDEELDLRSIIAQLQAEVDAMDAGEEDYEDDGLDLDLGDEEEDELDLDFDAGSADDIDSFDDIGDEDEEELDLEAILGEIEAELAEEEELEMAQENSKLKRDLSEAYEAVKLLRDRLNEVNLLNAKLLFTNKLFRGRELNTEQKRHVVETFDLATTLREVRLLYATLAEATIPAGRKRKERADTSKVVTEGIASTVVGGPKNEDTEEGERRTDINEGLRSRLQELAGIKVL